MSFASFFVAKKGRRKVFAVFPHLISPRIIFNLTPKKAFSSEIYFTSNKLAVDPNILINLDTLLCNEKTQVGDLEISIFI